MGRECARFRWASQAQRVIRFLLNVRQSQCLPTAKGLDRGEPRGSVVVHVLGNGIGIVLRCMRCPPLSVESAWPFAVL